MMKKMIINRKDEVKHCIYNKIDMGYKMKCENCLYSDIKFNDRKKIESIYCKYLKSEVDIKFYNKLRTCNFFLKKEESDGI